MFTIRVMTKLGTGSSLYRTIFGMTFFTSVFLRITSYGYASEKTKIRQSPLTVFEDKNNIQSLVVIR